MADEPLSGLSGTFTFGYSTANVMLLLDVLDTSMYTTGTDKGIPVSTFLAQYFHAGSNISLTPGSSGVTVAATTPASLPSPFTITSGGPTLLNVIPMMYTDTNGPPPLVASASTEVNTSNQAWNAFDYNSATRWLASGTSGWLQIDLGAGNAVVSTAYSIQATDSGNLSFMMTGWTLAGSNDGSSWTTLDTESSITWTALQTQTWSFTNVTAYRYYRLTSSSNNGGGLCGVGALLVLATSTAAPLSVSSTVINVGGNLNPAIQLYGTAVVSGGLTVGGAIATYGNITCNQPATGNTLTVNGTASLGGLTVPGLTISSGGLTLGTSANNAYQIGSNVQFAYASSGSSWMLGAQAGDAIIRNASNRILIGVGSTDYPQLIASSTGTQILSLVTTGSPLVVTGMASQTAPLLPLQNLSSTATARNCGVIDATFNTSTDASWTGNLLLYAGDYTSSNAGQRLGIQVQSNGSVALIGHYGATPVIQPQTTGTTTGTTAGTTTALHADSSATGNTGSTAYTLGDIVLALKQLGLLKT